MNTTRRHKFGLWIVVAMLPALVHCHPAKFAEYPSSSSSAAAGGADSTGLLQYQTRVAMSAYTPPAVDITWVIDNSGSMAEEAAHVRSNFESFINTVSLEADLKTALISRSGNTGTNVRMPPGTPNSVQINYAVGSTDALEIAVAAVCPQNPSAGSNCRSVRDQGLNGGHAAVAGELSTFLRPNAKQAFIIVTDDESRIPGSHFLSALDEVWPNQRPLVYGFMGLATTPSPCAMKSGVRYQELTTSTGGAAYNICDSDWSHAFSQIANHVVRLASAPIALPVEFSGAIEVISIELNGGFVDASQYSLTPNGLYFDPSLTRGLTEADVRITYRRKP